MAAEYQVQYHIEVLSESALKSINKFKAAIQSLGKVTKPLTDLQRQIRSLNDTLAGLKSHQVKLNVSVAKKQLQELQAMANQLKTTLTSVNVGAVAGAKGSKGGKTTAVAAKGAGTTAVAGAGSSVGHTGHMPLIRQPRVSGTPTPAGWLPAGNRHYDDYRKYVNGRQTGKQIRSIDRQVRAFNDARYNEAEARAAVRAQWAEDKRYQNWLRQNSRGWIQKQWDERRAQGKNSAAARRAYLNAQRDEIYGRHGITSEMRNAPVGPLSSYPPTITNYASRKPKGRSYRSNRKPQRRMLGGSGESGIWSSKNLGYKLLGPTPLTANGGMAIDMLKGMGIAYGLAGIGQAFGNIVEQSTEYDNTMKTVENILKAHNSDPDFQNKFSSMQSVVRGVGMETKFKITEVADAAKFLSMAGLNADDITNAMRPIADIALVGDSELGETADVVTNIMTAYNIPSHRMRTASDIMTNTFTMTNTTLMEMAQSYKYAASLLSAANVPFAESAAAIGVLGDAGIKGSQAGTTLRTIMANILNPTDPQKIAWEFIGVDPKGKSLIEIFEELREKNLGANVYYRLFHKTAASGAVALAKHSDKWRNVYTENLLSEGLSSRLADEKKNTLQGLWAQLTSVFTDDGVKAFAGIQGSLRNFLKETTDWLKGSEAQTIINELFLTFKEFGSIIVDATKKFYGFYEAFKPFLMGWMKFQLTIWPYVKMFQALRTVIMSIVALRGAAMGTLGILGVKGISGAGTQMINTTKGGPMLYGGPIGGMVRVTRDQIEQSGAGLNLKKPYLVSDGTGAYGALVKDWNKSEKSRYKNARRKQLRRLAGYQIGNTAKAIGGSAVGMGLMGLGATGLLKEDKSWADWLSGGAYSVAGLAAMAGGPVGWTIAGIGALVGGAAQFVAHLKDAEKIAEQFAFTAEKNQMVNGILANSEDSQLTNLALIFDKHNEINDSLEKRIDILNKLAGIEKSEPDPGVSETFAETLKQIKETEGRFTRDSFLASANNIFSAWNKEGKWGYGPQVDKDGFTIGEQYYYEDGHGNKYTFTGASQQGISRTVAAAEAIKKGYGQQMAKDFHSAVARRIMDPNAKLEDLEKYFNDYAAANNPTLMKGLSHSTYNLDTWDQNEALNNYFIRKLLWADMDERFKTTQDAVLNFKRHQLAGTLTENDILNLAAYGRAGDYFGVIAADMVKDNLSWLEMFHKNFGFDIKNGFSEYQGRSPLENADAAIAFIEMFQNALTEWGLMGESASDASFEIWQATNFLQAAAVLQREGEAKMLEQFGNTTYSFLGLTYQWDTINHTWRVISEDTLNSAYSVANNTGWATNSLWNFSSSIFGLGNTIAGFNWSSLWNSMLPDFSNISFNFGSGNQSSFASEITPFSTSIKNDGTGFKASNPFSNLTFGTGSFLGGTSFTSGNSFLGGNIGSKNFGNNKNNKISNNKNAFSIAQSVNADNGDQYSPNIPKKRDKPKKEKTPKAKTPKTPKTPKASSSDYKSNYNNNGAAPKQVIVNIENLMNVSKVDLSKADNAAAVQDLKAQLSQALIDVVHDFDETWHG